jgi:hypothetical protein
MVLTLKIIKELFKTEKVNNEKYKKEIDKKYFIN